MEADADEQEDSAILLHRTICAAVVGNLHGDPQEDDEVLISYLPLSHIYERFIEDMAFGASRPPIHIRVAALTLPYQLAGS